MRRRPPGRMPEASWRDRATRVIVLTVTALLLVYAVAQGATAAVRAVAAALALIAAWRVFACDVLPSYPDPLRRGLLTAGVLLTAPTVAIILVALAGHPAHVP